jgi:hypothetical protein
MKQSKCCEDIVAPIFVENYNTQWMISSRVVSERLDVNAKVVIVFPWGALAQGATREPPPPPARFAHLRRQMDCFKYAHIAQPHASTVSTKPITT